MTSTQRKVIKERVLDLLKLQSFDTFYKGPFEDHIGDSQDQIAKKKVDEFTEKFLNRLLF